MSVRPPSAGCTSRILSPRTWSLRLRLLVTQVVLLAVVCASIGVATEFALQRFLMHQLDDQLVEAGKRSAAISELPPPVRAVAAGPCGLPQDAPRDGPTPGRPTRRR